MPNRSREKGCRFELSIVHQAQQRGLKAKRIPLSGQCEGYKGDVIIEGRCLECKKRAGGFIQIRKWMRPEIDGVVIGADREEPLIVVRLDSWLTMLSL